MDKKVGWSWERPLHPQQHPPSMLQLAVWFNYICHQQTQQA
jgi:hypothetical protein